MIVKILRRLIRHILLPSCLFEVKVFGTVHSSTRRRSPRIRCIRGKRPAVVRDGCHDGP